MSRAIRVPSTHPPGWGRGETFSASETSGNTFAKITAQVLSTGVGGRESKYHPKRGSASFGRRMSRIIALIALMSQFWGAVSCERPMTNLSVCSPFSRYTASLPRKDRTFNPKNPTHIARKFAPVTSGTCTRDPRTPGICAPGIRTHNCGDPYKTLSATMTLEGVY